MSGTGEEKDSRPGPGLEQKADGASANPEISTSSVAGTETVPDKFSDGNHEAQAHTPPSSSQTTHPEENTEQTPPDDNIETKGNTQEGSQTHPASTPGYYNYQHATPPPNSPAGHILGYESPYVIPQGAAGVNFGQQQFGMAPPPPLSPGQPINVNNGAQLRTPDINDAAAAAANHNLSMGILAPSSPLFPASMAFVGANSEHMNMDASNASRMNTASLVAPPSPSVQYISAAGHPASPGYGGVGIYSNYGAPQTIGYPTTGNTTLRDIASSPDTRNGVWPVERTQASPHVQSQPLTMPFPATPPQQTNNVRTASFDEMLPPSVVEDSGNNVYSAPGISATTSSGGPTMFSQPSWGYNPNTAAGPPVPGLTAYSLQQQQQQQGHGLPPSIGMGGGGNAGGGPRGGLNPRNQQMPGGFYPATTPGPPIQTTHHNKGPDGANLFIFHIPNHFTNLDMWHLFCHYGNLLSVRIMVEKDTGRSRGFGFVSYDSPDAAAMAIKELNGFVIGNKRLKVQHKQIRQSDNTTAQQENAHAPPLFPQMSNVHNMPVPDAVTSIGANGVHHGMIGRNDWLSGSHDGTGEPNTATNTTNETQTNADADSNILLSEVGPNKSENEASLGINFDTSGTKQHMESALNLESIRDALPS